jgi:hypothetical protein
MLELLSTDPQHPALQRFENNLPAWFQSTDDLSHGLKRRSKTQGIQCRYVELYPRRIANLVLDIDRPNAIFAAEDANLPPPSLVVQNPANRHAHLIYALDAPVSAGKNSHQAPQDYLRAIQTAYTEAAKADAGFTHFIAKNPLHPHWNTYATNSVYSLAELAEHVELQPRAKVKTSGLGRNSTLFESLRHWAYGLAPKAISFETLLATIEAQAEAVNASFATALPANEVKSTSKSVAKFCWINRHRFGQRVGVMGFAPIPPWTPEAERQAEEAKRERAGGQHRGQQRATDFEARLVQALKPLAGQTLHARYVRDYLIRQNGLRTQTVFSRFPLSEGMIQIP